MIGVLILLPPSEGKASPSGKRTLDLDSLAFADQLGPKRAELIAALEKLASGSEKKGIEALGISKGQAGELARDAELATSPVAPASAVYTGVLYDRLDFDSLTATGRKRAAKVVLISSALWGFLAPGDRIPYYRFSMGAKLPKIGGLPAFWRESLRTAMEEAGHDEEGGLVLDMRSGSYSAAWKPKRARLVTVRGFTESPTRPDSAAAPKQAASARRSPTWPRQSGVTSPASPSRPGRCRKIRKPWPACSKPKE